MSALAKLSVAEYEKIVASGVFDGKNSRRIELICGELRLMNPIGSEHAMAVDWLTAWSYSATSRDLVWVRGQNPLSFIELDSEPEPDVAWVINKGYGPGHPTADDVFLLIEVADSTLDFDRGEKANLYAAAGIRDYWIANLIDRTVEVHRDPYHGRYRSVQSHGTASVVEASAVPGARLNIDSLFAALG